MSGELLVKGDGSIFVSAKKNGAFVLVDADGPMACGCCSQWWFTDLGFIDGGQEGGFREYRAPKEVKASPWRVFNDGLSLRLDWENDNNCSNHNPNTQYATALWRFEATEDVSLKIDWSGVGETQDSNYEYMRLYINGERISEAHAPGGGKGCGGGMAAVVSDPSPPQTIKLKAGMNTFFVDATTNDALYHVNAWYRFDLKFM